MKNWDWKDVVMFTALFIGIVVELILAVSAALFVLYEIWHFISTIFIWFIDNLPSDALPFAFFLTAAIVIGVMCYNHYNCIEAEEAEQ